MENGQFRVTNDMLATQGQRLGNYFIDLLVQYGLTFGLGFVLAALALLLGFDGFLNWLSTIDKITEYLFYSASFFESYFFSPNILFRKQRFFIR